ncbi:hypothetical protein M0R72_11860 [Candidatus Pacearchaeota archaeon]|jgi:hypothetical protein|nr:hypothetical protein [Candidatus Pacearchaeota archaeon]
MKPPYCEIHGLICTDVISSIDIDGADKKISSQAQPGQRLGEIQEQGRNPRKITLNARFLTEEDLDDWVGHINSVPEDCEAYLFRDDRCVYIKSAFAQVNNPEVAIISGQATTFFRGKGVLHARESWMYGAEKGIRYESPHALPITISGLEHEGTVESLTCLDKLTVVGQYISSYVENLALTCTPLGGVARSLILNTKLMRGDLFEVDRFGNVEHSYESKFDCDISALQSDLQGATYLAYCTISNGKLTISGAGKCIFPFYGPLPISAEKPYIDLDIFALGAYAPTLVSGVESDLSDLVEVPIDLQVGTNRVYIPDHEGDSDLFMGFIERRCWITAANMNYAVGYTAGKGNASNAICMGGYFGGYSKNYTQVFNGTTWSTVNAMTNARRMHAAGGSPSNAICMGGIKPSINYMDLVDCYNGTAWSAGGNLTTGRNGPAGGGNSSGAICMGGKTSDSSPYYTATTEEYNGTAWSAGGAIGDAKTQLGGGGNVISAMCCGGYDLYSVYAKHEIYNGSTWQQAGNLSQARSNLAADGDSGSGIAMGGDAGNPVGTMEEYDGTAWSAGGSSLITARYGLAGGGTSISAICMGGVTPTGINLGANYHANTETYGRNGSMTLNSIKAVVKRYIDPAILPTVDPGDTFSLKLDSDGAEELTYLELYFRDAWWF